jgi:TPR repeat protein
MSCLGWQKRSWLRGFGSFHGGTTNEKVSKLNRKKITSLHATFYFCLAALENSHAIELAKVISVTPVIMQTRLVCGDSLPPETAPESSVTMRGFGVSRTGVTYCAEARSTGDRLAGYRVTIEHANRIRTTAIPNVPSDTIEIDSVTGQIVTVLKDERPLRGSPPKFDDCRQAYDRKDDHQARTLCGWLAERGDPDAQNKLANLYFDGRGGVRDVQEALRWDKLGAEQGHPRSMNNLGYMYEHAQGVQKDFKQAFYWYSRAAKHMDPYGMTNLATLYEKGIGVQADITLAAEYYRRAAQAGNSNAQNGLGALYETGRGVPQSDSEAARWYRAAAQQGEARGKRNLDRLLGRRPDLQDRGVNEFVAYPSMVYALPNEKTVPDKLTQKEVTNSVQIKSPPSRAAELAQNLPQAKNQNPNGIAILIGNQKYDHRDIPPVSFASNDVELMRQFATRTLGFEQVYVLNGASKGDIESHFGTRDDPNGLLTKWVVPGQTEIFVYFSGHGAPGLQDQRGYLLPRDANPATVNISGYPIDTLYSNLTRLNAKRITVVLEACFSGMSAGGTLVPRSSALVIKPKLPSTGENLLVISASGADQVASWDEDAHLGLMTRHFIEGVSGSADINKDKTISSTEMQEYLSQKVTNAARMRYGREQKPSLMGAGQVPLAQY